MKKTYIIPETSTHVVRTESALLQFSNGLHNEFNVGDETYSRRNTSNVWDDEEEDF